MENSVNFVVQTSQPIVQDGFGIVTLNLKPLFGKPEYKDVVNSAYSIQAEVESANAAVNANNIAALEIEWEAARLAARNAKAEYDTAKQQELRYTDAELQAQNAHRESIRRYSNLKNSKPHPNSYPSKEELYSWEQSCDAAKQTVEAAYAGVETASKDAVTYYAGLRQLADVFNAAAKTEFELRNRLNALKGVKEEKNSSDYGLIR